MENDIKEKGLWPCMGILHILSYLWLHYIGFGRFFNISGGRKLLRCKCALMQINQLSKTFETSRGSEINY